MNGKRWTVKRQITGGDRNPLFSVSCSLSALFLPVALAAQALPPDIARERADFAAWLQSAPNSPLAAIARQPLDRPVTLGPPDADIPLPGVPITTVSEEGGAVTMIQAAARRPLARERVLPLGAYVIYLAGSPGQTIFGVFGKDRKTVVPSYYPYDPALVHSVSLSPLSKPRPLRLLTLDGVEVEAMDVGTVQVPLGGTPATLRVYRIPDASTGEADLTVYFRDGTSGQGSYPAGRFVVLTPQSGGAYLLDFNRARNPFCAYSSVYPCPVPWPGNTLAAEMRAGEMY